MDPSPTELDRVAAQRAACRRYQQSEKGREAYRRANAKYRCTEGGKATMRESKRRWRQQARERQLMEEALRETVPVVEDSGSI